MRFLRYGFWLRSKYLLEWGFAMPIPYTTPTVVWLLQPCVRDHASQLSGEGVLRKFHHLSPLARQKWSRAKSNIIISSHHFGNAKAKKKQIQLLYRYLVQCCDSKSNNNEEPLSSATYLWFLAPGSTNPCKKISILNEWLYEDEIRHLVVVHVVTLSLIKFLICFNRRAS